MDDLDHIDYDMKINICEYLWSTLDPVTRFLIKLATVNKAT